MPDLEIFTINANAPAPPLDVELKVRGDVREMLAAYGRAAGKLNTLEIQASIENNYGEMVQASWKCRGLPTNIPTTTLRLRADIYEHIIDGEEKYYIDVLENIRRIWGKDQLAARREILGI